MIKRILNTSIFTKILVSTMLLIIIPLVLVSLFTYYKITDISQEEFSSYSLEATRQINANVNLFLNEMDKMSIIVATNSVLQNALTNESGIDYHSLVAISDFITNINSIKMDGITFIIAGLNGDLYYNSEYFNVNSKSAYYGTKPFLEYDFLDNSIVTALNDSGQRRLFTDLHHPPYREPNENVYTIVRKIVNRYSGDVLGYVYVDISYDTLNEIIESPENMADSNILLICDRKIIFSKNQDLLFQSIEESHWETLTSGISGSDMQNLRGENTFYTYQTIPTTGWKLVFLHSSETYHKSASTILRYSHIITVICIAFSFLIAMGISWLITSPLKRLSSLMGEVEKNNLDVVFESKSNDEVSRLGNAFNKMIAQIKLMIQKVSLSKLAEKDAVIYALQSQINPHFLYNTLQSISDVSYSYDIMEIPEICSSLSSMLRYSIDNQKRFVRLYDEIENIRNYYSIQSIKYQERVTLTIRIDPCYYNVRIPRLILQPLVENSFTHGFSSSSDLFSISIEAREDSGSLYITIADNGSGITPKQLTAIRASLALEDDLHHTEKYLALNNVNRRLILNYGPEYGLKIESWLSKGTNMTVTIPIGGYITPENNLIFHSKEEEEHVSSSDY